MKIRDSLRNILHAFTVTPGKIWADKEKLEKPTMSKEQNYGCDEFDIAALQNEIATLRKENEDLTKERDGFKVKFETSEKTVKETGDALTAYKNAERKALIDSIAEKSEFKADELKDTPVEELRLIHSAIDKAKPAPPQGTVKNVRGAGDGAPTRPDVAPDGRIDATKSLLGNPKRNADGSLARNADGSVIWEVK